MATFDDKIQKLREIYTIPEEQRIIDDVEKNIRRLIGEQRSIKDNPVIQAMIESARKKVHEINFLLAYDEKLNAPTDEARILRQALIRERSMNEFNLDRFGLKIEKELESLNKFLDQKLE